VAEIRRAGTTVLLVEQRMTEALEIADRVYVLRTGRLVMQGSAKEIGNAELQRVYLGL
jgi:branched-chain amino acid transport system ATP-binding protein